MSDIDLVRDVLNEHPDSVNDYRDGDKAAKNYLVGQVMQSSGGRMNPKMANNLIDKVIEEDTPAWPFTLTFYSRPIDKIGIQERLASKIPKWAHDEIPDEIVDPTSYEPKFKVTVYKDGTRKIRLVEE